VVTPYQNDKFSKHSIFKNENSGNQGKYIDPLMLSYGQKMKLI
jgi:hypothetical protein